MKSFLYTFFCLLATSTQYSFVCNQTTNNSGDASKVISDTINSNSLMASPEDGVLTPEMFGATGDGKIHKLSERYKTINEARKDFPNVKDMEITIDGAAFQKAVDVASEKSKTILAKGSYIINYPIVTRSNIVIDGENKGIITNDASRTKNIQSIAFFFGNHSASAFDANNKAYYKFYNIKGGVTAGQSSVSLSGEDIAKFKQGQLVMVVSSSKRKQNLKMTLLPYHVTICKILKISDNKLFFEYPMDESIADAQIAANGGFDNLAEMDYGGVENVVIKNLTISAQFLTLRTYGYKCVIDNIKMKNSAYLIGLNAMTHSTISNVSGTFAARCIEIKTGTSDLVLRNIEATYKPLKNEACIDAIALGEYNRNIKIDGFKIDFGNANPKLSAINIRARKAEIMNGSINGLNQTRPFLQLYNEQYVNDPQFGCYGNSIKNVKFYGGNLMKQVLIIGDEVKANNNANRSDWAYQKYKNKTKNKSRDAEDDQFESVETGTENVPPQNNTINDCLFDGGAGVSKASLINGENNVIENCHFSKAKIEASALFNQKNKVSNNKGKN